MDEPPDPAGFEAADLTPSVLSYGLFPKAAHFTVGGMESDQERDAPEDRPTRFHDGGRGTGGMH